MDKRKYSSRLVSALNYATISQLANTAMAIAICLLSYFVVTADTSEKTIITPAFIEKSFSIHGNNVSPEYLEQMTELFANYLMVYQKQNAKYRFEQVLKYFHPSVYASMKSHFDSEIGKIQRNDIASVFYPQSIHVDRMTVYVTGERVGLIGAQLVGKQQKTYEFKYEYGATLTITAFNEVERNSLGGYTVKKPEDQVMVEQPQTPEKTQDVIPPQEQQKP